MADRIVLFGATGYTGELTARALVARGARPVLAGRTEARVRALAEELGGLDWAVADVERPESVHALVERGDVLLTTVGPFGRWGEPALEAALRAGAHYLDSTGEGAFIRAVFEDRDAEARAAGVALLTSFGYDWVPGNLAGALALREAGDAATRVEIGYFNPGATPSGGTRASVAGVLLAPGFAQRTRTFELRPGREARGVSVVSSERFTLARVHPGLRDVEVFLGWFGPASRPLHVVATLMGPVLKLPGARGGLHALAGQVVKGSTGGPDAAGRAKSRSIVLAEAYDAAGERLASVRLEGGDPYDLTAAILAWGAQTAAGGGLQDVGALGPVDAFGLDALAAGCAEAGLLRVPA